MHCIQNHDQIGNRAAGDRLHESITLAEYRVLSALLLTSPYTPLLFMGQEWAASSPFQFFTDFPGELGALVTAGRQQEFAEFSAFRASEARSEVPDPQAEETFLRSRLRWSERTASPHAQILALYEALLELRRSSPALRRRERGTFAVEALSDDAMALRREAADGRPVVFLAQFGNERIGSAPITRSSRCRPVSNGASYSIRKTRGLVAMEELVPSPRRAPCCCAASVACILATARVNEL